MFIDAATVVTRTIETEVCIIGAGPAGITLAREFAEQKFQVCLLESGNIEFNDETQLLCQGETIGDSFLPLDYIRRRQFGGTANCWEAELTKNIFGFRCVPLDKIDFEKREWLPYSGWPFNRSHLEPYYKRAQSVCKVGAFTYEPELWEDAQTQRIPFAGDRVSTSMFQLAPRTIFTHDYREEVGHSSNITTYLNANVVEIETNETAKTVTRVRVACLQGNQFWVCAKVFILATGGIENARLLLLSNKTQTTGLGNQNDLVGRFFMDHPNGHGTFIPNSQKVFSTTDLYNIRQVNNLPVQGKLTLSEEVMHREQLLGLALCLTPEPKVYQSNAIASMKTLLAASRSAQVPQDALQHLGNAIGGLDYISSLAYWAAIKRLPGRGQDESWYLRHSKERFSLFKVLYQTEQAPNPDNRVVLSRDRDRLGCQKVELHWRWRDIDIRSLRRSQEIFREEIARTGLGHLETGLDGEVIQLQNPAGMHHPTGTTRMHIDPKQGVVDENCQVYGISNLFISGSSVFPTGSYANPTLTIVALAIRLADHVKTIMTKNTAAILSD